jgi:drug/metabolite transporter (DMT)-like permease
MRPKDWLAFIALGTIWGSSFLWIKIAVQEISPLMLVSLRLLIGGVGLGAIAFYAHPTFPRNQRIWLGLIFLGFINSGIPFLMISWGEQYIESAIAAILNSTTPLFTMLIAATFLSDDKLTLRRSIGLLVGFVGIVILVSRDLSLSGLISMVQPVNLPRLHTAGFSIDFLKQVPFSILGQLAVLGASFFYGISSVFARRTTQGISPIVTGLVPLIGADAALWAVVGVGKNTNHLPILPITWLAVIWLGLIGTALSFILFYYLIHSVGPTRTSLVTYVFPLVGVILGVLVLHELLDWRVVVGGGLIVGSIVVVNKQ